MADQNPLIQEIRAAPEDLTARLVYADWLEEQGDPVAELIRIQCELAEIEPDPERKPVLIERERELLEEYHDTWVIPLQERFDAMSVRISGGFVESLRVNADVFLQNADEIVGMLPGLTALNLGRSKRFIADLAHEPALQQLRNLDIRHARLDDSDISTLLASPYLTNLIELNLCGNNLTSIGAQRIADSEVLSNLQVLDLARNPIGDDGLEVLGQSSSLNNARRLIVRNCDVTIIGLLKIGYSSGMPNLRDLYLGGNDLWANTAGAGDRQRPIRTLSLWGCNLHPTFTQNLEFLPIQTLEALDVSGNSLGLEGLVPLLQSQSLTSLKRLVASRVLTRHWNSTEWFDLPQLQPSALTLEHLNLESNALSDSAFVTLAESGLLKTVRRLLLNRTGIAARGLQAILKGTEQLEELQIARDAKSAESANFAQLIGAWPGLSRLRRLEIGAGAICRKRRFAHILESPYRKAGLKVIAVSDGTWSYNDSKDELRRQYGPAFDDIVQFK